MNYSKIESLRKLKKISKIELCRRAKINPQTYYLLIDSKSDVKLSTLEGISNALGVSPSVWWNDEPISVQDTGTGQSYSGPCPQCQEKDKLITVLEDDRKLLIENNAMLRQCLNDQVQEEKKQVG